MKSIGSLIGWSLIGGIGLALIWGVFSMTAPLLVSPYLFKNIAFLIIFMLAIFFTSLIVYLPHRLAGRLIGLRAGMALVMVGLCRLPPLVFSWEVIIWIVVLGILLDLAFYYHIIIHRDFRALTILMSCLATKISAGVLVYLSQHLPLKTELIVILTLVVMFLSFVVAKLGARLADFMARLFKKDPIYHFIFGRKKKAKKLLTEGQFILSDDKVYVRRVFSF